MRRRLLALGVGLGLAWASGCQREHRPSGLVAPLTRASADEPGPKPVERCRLVAAEARAAGRLDLAAEALGGAAQLEPTSARRLEWARALADAGRQRRAREVASTLVDDPDASIHGPARSLAATDLPSPPAPDPALADRVLAAYAAGVPDEVLRELSAHESSLSIDMLRRLAEVLHERGDVDRAGRVWSRVRGHYGDLEGGWKVVQGGPLTIRSLAAGPDGLTLVSAGPNDRPGAVAAYILRPDGASWSAWSLYGEEAAWFGPHRTVLCWGFGSLVLRDADSAALLAERGFSLDAPIHHVAVAPSSATAAIVRPGVVELVDATLAARATFAVDTDSVDSAVLGPSGTEVALIGRDGGVRLLDARTGRVRALRSGGLPIEDGALRQDGRLFMLAWSGRDPVVRWRHGDREGRARSVRSAERLEGRGYAHALAPDGSRLVVADAQGLAVLELASGAVQRRARPWQGRVHLDFSDDGSTLVAADESAVTRHAAGDLSLVSRWSLAGSGIAADAGHGPPRASIVGVAAGGNWLYAERRDYGFRAFGLDPASDPAPWFTFGESYEPLGVKTVHAFSGDGRTLALGREDAGEVHVVRDGAPVRTLSVDDVVRGLAVSDSGARVAAATGEEVRIYEDAGPPRPLADSDIAPRRLAFDAGESRLIAHTEDRSLVVWSLTSGARLGVYGPADDLGALDDDAARIAYWSGATLHVATMSAEPPETRDFQPCGPDCRLRAAGFMADGASLEVIYSAGAADRRIALRIDSGSVRELPADASRLVPPGFLRAGGFVMGPERRDFAIEHAQGDRALSVAVTGGLDGWAASTPSGIVDGRFARPWALALQSPGDRALFDISPFMAEARAPGMVPALLRDGLPPACSVDFHAWRRPQATPVPPTEGKALEKPEDE